MTLKYGLLSAALAVMCFAAAAEAKTYTSKSNGNYSVDATWNEGGNPGVGATSDTVTISAPHVVTVTNKYTASNDVVIVNPGAVLQTPMSNTLSQFLAGTRIDLRGGTLSVDVREWEGLHNGSQVIVSSNSLIDTYDSYSYYTLGHVIFGSLIIQPGATKVTFTNSLWNLPPYEIACFSFTNGISLSNSVEFCTETPKAYVELNNLSISNSKVLTKTGSGRLQVKGTPNIKGNIVVNEGTIEPLTVKCLGTNELTLNPGTTLFMDYLGGGTGLQDLPITLNGGSINYGYNSWAQTLRGQILVKSNATINIYNYHSTINGSYISFDTLAFGEDPSGAGYELHCTQLGSHANWSNTVIGSKLTYGSTISNNAVINADKNAGLWFDKALVLVTNKTLTKKGEGVLTLNGVFTNAGSLVVEAGAASIYGPLAVNNAAVYLANNATGTGVITMTGGAFGLGDIVLSNNSAIATGITLSTAVITNIGRIVNSGTGSGSVLISAPIGVNVAGLLQDSTSSALILSGSNTCNGSTVIASGRLVVSNAAGSATGSGAVTVRNGATLLGAGTLAGTVTNSHGAAIRPGFDGVPGGTLTLGNLTWNGGGSVTFDVASLANNEAGAGIDYGQVVVTNVLTAVPGGSNLVIRLDSLGQTLAVDPDRNYSLKLITCGKSATLSPADVTLDTNDFLAGGTWVLTNLNKSIYAVCLGAPSSGKNYWRGTGNWSTATNWSLGHAPLAGEDVEFDLMGAANCSVDLANNNLGSLTVSAGYTGTVIFLTKFPAQGGFTNLTVTGDVSILGGALSHGANTTGEVYRLALTVGGNLTVSSGSRITADSQGFSAINGPGKQTVGTCSGSHGGLGFPYAYNASYIPGPSYGTITAPTNCGSGGNATAGGGAIRIIVAGTSTVNSVISADGNGTAANYSGSGGSVFLTTGYLTGTGMIRANGGYVSANRSGAGGRVAVILTASTSAGPVGLQAYPGVSPGGMHGSGGTVYLESMGQTPGQGKLIVDYGNLRIGNSINCTLQNGLSPSSYAFSEIVLTNGGVYALDTNDVLDVTGTTLRGDPSTRDDGIYLLGGTLSVPAAFAFSNTFVAVSTNATFNPTVSLTVDTNATMRFDVPWVVNYPITLKAGGWLSHSPNSSSEAIKLNLTINNNLDIQPGGQVNVDGMGYAATFGPGTGSGGSHGGQGSKYSIAQLIGPTYGSITTPTNIGSGGTSLAGGGAVRLFVTGTTTVNGTISAKGNSGVNYAGSGGSILLTTGDLVGNGIIQANGGNANPSGGGGRVAVILTNSPSIGQIVMQAFAGTGVNPGAPGTVYWETPAQQPGKGTLVVDASNVVASASSDPTMLISTLISSQVTDTVVGTVIITNKAILAINTNQSLTVNGSWSNAATFIGRTNSTVILAGPGAATVTGSNAFYNLIITNADKVVSFQAGKTNTVAGLLKLGSAVQGSTVTLKSTVDGSWWYVNLSSNAGATQQIARVTVRDSHAGGGQLLVAAKGSIDGGHNVNWQIPHIGGTILWVK